MKWKFCEDCYINGHCENQDKGDECNVYSKRITEKCDRLEKQLAIAVDALKEYADRVNWQNDFGYPCLYSEDKGYEGAEKALKDLEDLEK